MNYFRYNEKKYTLEKQKILEDLVNKNSNIKNIRNIL